MKWSGAEWKGHEKSWNETNEWMKPNEWMEWNGTQMERIAEWMSEWMNEWMKIKIH